MQQQREHVNVMELRARYIILLLLAEGPKTGYEILKRVRLLFEETSEKGLSPGTLYPLLRRMMEEGLLAAEEEPRGQRRRKVYTLTQLGLEKLLDMVGWGLDILEKSFQLHLAAARRLVEQPGGQATREKLAAIAVKLRRIETLARELRTLLEEAGGDNPPGTAASWPDQ